jgi:glycosyltransferase involved in cell wall biosynthesis
LYESYGVPPSKCFFAPYSVDNDRFTGQAKQLRPMRAAIRSEWGIAPDAFCVLFCGKFIPKKRPDDLIKAAIKPGMSPRGRGLHLLFAGSGELGPALRAQTNVTYDAEASGSPMPNLAGKPLASFVGFLNQQEVSKAYVAADCLVLPSDHGETWGLVVNEAMASGLPCIISDRCGAAVDLGTAPSNRVFPCGNIENLAQCIADVCARRATTPNGSLLPESFSFATTIATVTKCAASLESFQSNRTHA